MTSTYATNSVDPEAVRTSFRLWETEQAELDAQIAESFDALVAYQSHLDDWQRQLVEERDNLRELRATVEQDQALAGAEQTRMEQANKELNDARQQIASLTAVLLARTEELRVLDNQRGDANTEREVARAREQELAAALAARQQSFASERHQLQQEQAHLRQQLEQAVSLVSSRPAGRDEPSKSGSTRTETPRSTSPVLGSVMEQFGKLRQQRSLNRPNPKTR